MRYISFLHQGRPGYGRLAGETVLPLTGPADLKAALAASPLADLPAGAPLPLAEVTLLPPIPNPGKIICIGLNYAAHIAEMGRETLERPAIFTRWPDTLVAHGQ